MKFVKSIFGGFLKLSLIKKLIILVIIGGVVWFGGTKVFSKQEQPTYQTAQVEKGSLISTVTASGTVSSGSSVSITTQASGLVKEVYVQDGDVVAAGQKIADLNLDTSSQQKQAAAWASYLGAQSALNNSRNQVNTLQAQLFEANQKFINDAVERDLSVDDPTYIQQSATWKAAEGAYQNQQTEVAQAEAALNSAWLSYIQLSSEITAPTAGVVSGLTLTPGLPVATSSSGSGSNNSSSSSSTSTSLGTITLEQDKPKVSVNLTEIDVVKVKVGQKVTMTIDALPDKTFTGRVATVNTNGVVSSGVTTYPTTITLDTSFNKIYPNMAVNATVITNVKNDVLLVPTGAIQTANGMSSVRVMRDGQVSSVDVEIGDSNDTQTEIVSGISEGDMVIVGQTATGGNRSTGGTSPFGNTRGGGFGGPGGGGNFVIRRQ